MGNFAYRITLGYRSVLRFLLLTLTLCLGCALVIGAAVAVGRTQPPSEAVRWFHISDCETPCFMSVTLGKTSLTEAKQRLAAVTIPSGYIATTKVYVADERDEEVSLNLAPVAYELPVLYISFASEKGITRHSGMDIEFFAENLPVLTLADVVRTYGTPTCAYETELRGRHTLILYVVKPAYQVQVYVNYPLDWASPVSDLWIDPDDPSIREDCTFARSYWRGIYATYPPVNSH